MAGPSSVSHPARPTRSVPEDVPDIPTIEPDQQSETSTIYSHFRTGLSRRRTGLSEHRTDLSEFRTDLSQLRTELGSRRTGMALHRTRMAADRTLMAEIRTSLSMIGFGFTLYETFQGMSEVGTMAGSSAPRNFGLSLIVLGLLILMGGIWRHIQFANELRARRHELIADTLIHGDSLYPISVSLVVAVGLFVVGVFAVLNVGFGFGPFS